MLGCITRGWYNAWTPSSNKSITKSTLDCPFRSCQVEKQYETFETSSGSTQVVASLSSMEHLVSSLAKFRKENQILTAEKIQHAAESVKLVRRCRLLDNAELDVAASKLYQGLQSRESERIKSNMANLIHPITNKDIRNELRPRFLQPIVHVDHITVIHLAETSKAHPRSSESVS